MILGQFCLCLGIHISHRLDALYLSKVLQHKLFSYTISSYYMWPGVARAVLQTALWPGVARAVLQTALSLIESLTEWSFPSRSYKHHNAQTIRARELQFWENVHPTTCVSCHLSHVTCLISYVTCHMSSVKCQLNFFLLIFLKIN